MLNLQATEKQSTGIRSFNESEVDSVFFNGALGSLGASFKLGIEGSPEHLESLGRRSEEGAVAQQSDDYVREDISDITIC